MRSIFTIKSALNRNLCILLAINKRFLQTLFLFGYFHFAEKDYCIVKTEFDVKLMRGVFYIAQPVFI